MFLLVPAYPGCHGSKAVKRLLLLLLCHNIQVALLLQGKHHASRSESGSGSKTVFGSNLDSIPDSDLELDKESDEDSVKGKNGNGKKGN